MKNLGKLAVLGAALAVSSSLAFADTYTIESYGSAGLSGYNNSGTAGVGASNSAMQYVGNELGSPAYGCVTGCGNPIPSAPGTITAITPVTATDLNPVNQNNVTVWGGPVSNTSWVGIGPNAGPVNTSNPAWGYYEYTTMFSATAGLYSYNLQMYADDSVEVLLNGNLLFSLLPNQDEFVGNPKTATGSAALLASNTLTFIVEQTGDETVNQSTGFGNDPSGFDIGGTFAAPEPSSLMLLGTGLTSAAGMLFRRRRTA